MTNMNVKEFIKKIQSNFLGFGFNKKTFELEQQLHQK
jgi:hypothetical protein